MVHLAHLWGRLIMCPNRHRRQTSPFSALGESYKGEKPSPAPFSLEHRKVSRCSLPPTAPSRPRCISCRPGCPFWYPQDRGPNSQLASSLPLCTYFRPLSLPPTSRAVTAEPVGHRCPGPGKGLHFPIALASQDGQPACKSQHARVNH